MSGVRVTYSGLISLVIGFATAITGMIFIIIVTRTLTGVELGTWTLIGGLFTYVLIIEPILSYWLIRESARGIESAKTSIISSGLFSIAGISLYLLIVYFIGNQTDAEVNVLIFASLLVPIMFLHRTFTAINLGWKPHVPSYGLIVLDVTKNLELSERSKTINYEEFVLHSRDTIKKVFEFTHLQWYDELNQLIPENFQIHNNEKWKLLPDDEKKILLEFTEKN